MIRELSRSLPLLAFVVVNCLLMLLPVPSRGDPSCPNSESIPCGNVSISYPFWLLSNDTNGISPYCGYQSFMLTCQSGIPILHLGGDDYRVLDINYNDTVVSLADDDIYAGTPETCSSVRQNVALPSNLSLSYADAEANLTLFFNCTTFIRWPTPVIPCLQFDEPKWEFKYSYEHDSPTDCHNVTDPSVLKPFAGNEFVKQYTRILLEEGFKLHWMGDDNSGGRCGHNTADRATLAPTCFCSGGKIEVPPHGGRSPAGAERSPAGAERSPADAGMYPAGAQRKKHTKLIIGIVIGAMVGFILACFISSYILCFREPNEKEDQAIQNFIFQYESTTPKRYTYTEIKRMTKSFSDKLGNGGYGSVFKGSLQDGRLVAVKILSETKGNGEDFINEVASISRTSHVNIVALLGFCLEGSKRALVYEFMSNGSLDKFIFDSNLNKENSQLSQEKLYDIAVSIARGLEYLHRGCNTRIVHFDIKPHNILLDQDFCPKISDFGLAKICIQKDSFISTMAMRGTPGYIAPELFCRSFGMISSKSDVYSYGMMVLEMIGGRKNFNARADHTSETYFPHWVYDNLDDYCNLTASVSASEVSSRTKEIERKMIIVGLWCIQIKPENRPSISMVVDMLEGSISVLQMPPKPEFS